MAITKPITGPVMRAGLVGAKGWTRVVILIVCMVSMCSAVSMQHQDNPQDKTIFGEVDEFSGEDQSIATVEPEVAAEGALDTSFRAAKRLEKTDALDSNFRAAKRLEKTEHRPRKVVKKDEEEKLRTPSVPPPSGSPVGESMEAAQTPHASEYDSDSAHLAEQPSNKTVTAPLSETNQHNTTASDKAHVDPSQHSTTNEGAHPPHFDDSKPPLQQVNITAEDHKMYNATRDHDANVEIPEDGEDGHSPLDISTHVPDDKNATHATEPVDVSGVANVNVLVASNSTHARNGTDEEDGAPLKLPKATYSATDVSKVKQPLTHADNATVESDPAMDPDYATSTPAGGSVHFDSDLENSRHSSAVVGVARHPPTHEKKDQVPITHVPVGTVYEDESKNVKIPLANTTFGRVLRKHSNVTADNHNHNDTIRAAAGEGTAPHTLPAKLQPASSYNNTEDRSKNKTQLHFLSDYLPVVTHDGRFNDSASVVNQTSDGVMAAPLITPEAKNISRATNESIDTVNAVLADPVRDTNYAASTLPAGSIHFDENHEQVKNEWKNPDKHSIKAGLASMTKNSTSPNASLEDRTAHPLHSPPPPPPHGGHAQGVMRLPTHVTPTEYRLRITPNLEEFYFEGVVVIKVDIHSDTESIVLHATSLNITRVELLHLTNDTVYVPKIHFEPEFDFVRFNFPEEVPQGRGVLSIKYDGQLKDDMKGFYRSSYKVGNQTKWMATTKFEPTLARKAFPCFDEPAMKANFTIIMMVHHHQKAISNMPMKEKKEAENGLVAVHFHPTVKMSTYLVAFIVSDFEFISARTESETVVRIFTRPGEVQRGTFALSTTVGAMNFFTDYFGIPYVLPKIDSIAIPDFAAGAMENWGLVTYRETALLIDETQSGAANRQRTAEIICHELAHQWFGNLVTMKWWDDLWLNEGFARFMQFKCVDALFPEWHVWDYFQSHTYSAALSADALSVSRAVIPSKLAAGGIGEMFDSMTYDKGACLLRMLENYLNPTRGQSGDKFRDGIRFYLEFFRFDNADTEQLWKAMELVSGKPISKMMNAWVHSKGYPVIEVREFGNSFRSDNNSPYKYMLAQEPFTLGIEKANQEVPDSGKLWWVPVDIQGSDHSVETKDFETPRHPPFEADELIKLNSEQMGYYRVLYPSSMLDKLAAALKHDPHKLLDARDRAGLIDDLFTFAKGGILDVRQGLKFSSIILKSETSFVVWSTFLRHASKMYSLMQPDGDTARSLSAFVMASAGEVLSHVGYRPHPHEHHLTTLLRRVLLDASVMFGAGSGERDAALERYRNGTRGGDNNIPPDSRNAIYNSYVKHGGPQAYETILKEFERSQFPTEKNRLMNALSYAQDRELLRSTLELALSKKVRSQDAYALIDAVASNPKGKFLAWEFVKANWDELFKRYGHGGTALSHLIEGVTAGFDTDELLSDVKAFFKDHSVPTAQRSLAISLEKIEVNIRYREDQGLESLSQFLVPLTSEKQKHHHV